MTLAKALFISGTDTDVGKTVVTAGLAQALLAAGQRVCVYKPVQTGSVDLACPDDPMTIQRWLTQADGTVPENLTVFASYVFHEPVAPWVADPTGTIQMTQILADFDRLQATHDWVLVEGAGGLRVPVTAHDDTLDVVKALGLPVILVARRNLGTINHTLLSCDVMAQRQVNCLGVVVSGMPEDLSGEGLAVQSLPDVFAQWLPVPVLGWVPPIPLENTEARQNAMLACFGPWVKALTLRLEQPQLA